MDNDERIPFIDRLFRALFVGLAVGLGWGIRGDFGHELGAMFPGAMLGLGFAYVSGQRAAFRWMPLLGAIAALGISTGGTMSYGLLHGYAKADTLPNYAYGFGTLFLQGGAWGTFGCMLIGLALERRRVSAIEFASLVATIVIFGWITYLIVVDWIGFDINPGRSNASIAFTGGVIGQFLWFALHDRPYAFKGALFGYLGFGIGMSGGRLLANLSYLQPYAVNHWNIMEVSCGLIGGFIFTFGMLGLKYDDYPEESGFPLASLYGMFYVLALIPIFHLLYRIDPNEKLPEWTEDLTSWGYENADAIATNVLTALNLVPAAAIIAAVIWFLLHRNDVHRLAAYPILALGLIMLVFQDLNALFLLYPPREDFINMHFVLWGIYGLMVVFAVFYPRTQRFVPDDAMQKSRWPLWVASGILAYGLIVLAAGYINGEETMTSANTLWPEWSWRDGPFPGRE